MVSDVSVVIVNWNGARYLQACLGSIYGSTETVVVDNGSTDGSSALVRKLFPEVTFVENRRNVGFSAANNVGSRYCHGRYILFLNNDTVVMESTVSRMRRCFEDDARIAIVGARLERPDGRVQSASARPWISFSREARRILTVHNKQAVYGAGVDYDVSQYTWSVCGAGMMVRRGVLEELGGWPEEYFAYAEDVELCRKAIERGYGIWYESQARILHFRGGSGRGQGLLKAIRAHLISHRSVNRYIRKHEGVSRAVLHAMLYPVDVLLRVIRSISEKSRKAVGFLYRRAGSAT
ncbi:MAG: glycosyltransferase family 2 protein [Nitrospiraceae bacterium]